MTYEDYLMHFNPNHDPRNGQFAKKVGGAVNTAKQKIPDAARATKERVKKAGSVVKQKTAGAARVTKERVDNMSWRQRGVAKAAGIGLAAAGIAAYGAGRRMVYAQNLVNAYYDMNINGALAAKYIAKAAATAGISVASAAYAPALISEYFLDIFRVKSKENDKK